METLKNTQIERVKRVAKRMRQVNKSASDMTGHTDIKLRLQAEKAPDGLLTIKITNSDCSLSFLLQCSKAVTEADAHDFLSIVRELVVDGFKEWSIMSVPKDGDAPF